MRWIIAGLLAASTGLAAAQQSNLVDEIGAWGIYVDESLGNGCFAMVEYDGGTVFRIGFDRTDNSAYVIIGDDAWQSIEYDNQYPIELTFGDESPWSATASGFSFSPPADEPFLIFWISDANNGELFFQEFSQEIDVSLYFEDEMIASLNLDDSAKAAGMIIECQERQEAKSDPFAGGKKKNKKKKDPFGTR